MGKGGESLVCVGARGVRARDKGKTRDKRPRKLGNSRKCVSIFPGYRPDNPGNKIANRGKIAGLDDNSYQISTGDFSQF